MFIQQLAVTLQRQFFFLIIVNHDIINNNARSLHFFCFEGGEIVNDMKKVPGNMGIELKDKKHGELVNNLPINGKTFYNSCFLSK